MKRIQAHKGVVGVLIINNEGWSSSFIVVAFMLEILKYVFNLGIPIRTTLDNATSVQYAGLFQQLTSKARTTVRDIDPQVCCDIKLNIFS